MWRLGSRRWLRRAAAVLSVMAAAIHAMVIPEHFEEWWGYGAFFLAAFVGQGIYAAALLRLDRRWLLVTGIAGNMAIGALYAVTRTVGIPLFGPDAGEVKRVGSWMQPLSC